MKNVVFTFQFLIKIEKKKKKKEEEEEEEEKNILEEFSPFMSNFLESG